MKILITGGRGALGKRVASALICRQRPIVLVSRRQSSSCGEAETLVGDLADAAFVQRAIFGVTHIIHCAGEKNDPYLMETGNVLATQNLVDAATQQGVRRFIHVSSVGVIGRSTQQFIDEDDDCRPMNRYEETKLKAERILLSSTLDGAILRPTNIFDEQNLAPWLTMSMLKLCLRAREASHLVYMDDVVAAILFLLKSDDVGVSTYIMSSDDEAGSSVEDVVRLLTGRKPMIRAPIWVPYLTRLVRDRQTNLGNKVYSASKLFSAGFKRPYGLKNGLQRSRFEYNQY
ncbi:NAD(P)-dependent oxidoreductase [Mesorhizobium sp. B2-4-17]|uniref:NAD-dependent epimerase/dehydratase family protein n=1 Tax=Mesorhizobium sp. B2-4-17 TaxID=2589932 RepID=UPI0011271DAF|nr:NAD(P)-dependent oxidoreductase [Mesorhizobium sp. B2-4-17]TPK91794.1 NAD(P)-dependent oxidoreductase [Mesorhizobium sp. B2-4-17]